MKNWKCAYCCNCSFYSHLWNLFLGIFTRNKFMKFVSERRKRDDWLWLFTLSSPLHLCNLKESWYLMLVCNCNSVTLLLVKWSTQYIITGPVFIIMCQIFSITSFKLLPFSSSFLQVFSDTSLIDTCLCWS